MSAYTRVLSQLPQYLRGAPPRGVPVVRLRAPGPATWRIARETLRVAWGAQVRTYDVLDHTIASLVDALQADGFVLEWFDAEHYGRGAAVLKDGAGTAVDALAWSADITVLHSFTRPAEAALDAISDATPEFARQVSLDGADGDWLDHHGRLYGVQRPAGMDDAGYRAYIVAAIMRPRNTPRGIEQNVQRLGDGTPVRVREPWQEIITLSSDADLSGEKCLQGAPVYQYHTMQLVAPSGHNWPLWLSIANADRPAGTIMLAPATRRPAQAVAVGELLGSLFAWRIDWIGAHIVDADFLLSDNLVLSESRPPPLLRLGRVAVRGQATTGLRPASSETGWVGQWDQRKWKQLSSYEFYPPTRLAKVSAGGFSDGYYMVTVDGNTWARRAAETVWSADGGAGVLAPDAPGQAGDWYLASWYLHLCVDADTWCRFAVETTWSAGPWAADAAGPAGEDVLFLAPYWYRRVDTAAWVRVAMEYGAFVLVAGSSGDLSGVLSLVSHTDDSVTVEVDAALVIATGTDPYPGVTLQFDAR